MDAPVAEQILNRPGLGFLRSTAKAGSGAGETDSGASLITYCRLPGCCEAIVRGTGRGRSRWFCGDAHRNAYRLRADALDRAIADLRNALPSAGSVADERRQRGTLNWLEELRVQYDLSPRRGREQRELQDLTDSLLAALDRPPRQRSASAPRRARGSEETLDATGLLALIDHAIAKEALRRRQPGLVLLGNEITALAARLFAGRDDRS
jgi:hypothetical protein